MLNDIFSAVALFFHPVQAMTGKDVVIIVLALINALCLLKIRHLRHPVTVPKPQRQSVAPELMLEIDEKSGGLFLKNQSSSFAKSISVQDMTVNNLLNFSKPLIFKFDSVASLGPQEKAELKYQVFDDRYKIGPSESRSLIPHFLQATFEMHLTYANLEGDLFSSVIVNDHGMMQTRETAAQKKGKGRPVSFADRASHGFA